MGVGPIAPPFAVLLRRLGSFPPSITALRVPGFVQYRNKLILWKNLYRAILEALYSSATEYKRERSKSSPRISRSTLQVHTNY